MTILKLLLAKYKKQEYGAIYSKTELHYVRLIKRLYSNYFLTDKGIFKFDFIGYYKSMKMYFCDVVLPRGSLFHDNVNLK